MGDSQFNFVDPEECESDAMTEKPLKSLVVSQQSSIEVTEKHIDDMPQQILIENSQTIDLRANDRKFEPRNCSENNFGT